jgi:hypothetical protein
MLMHEVGITGKRTGSKVSKPQTKKRQLLKLQKTGKGLAGCQGN